MSDTKPHRPAGGAHPGSPAKPASAPRQPSGVPPVTPATTASRPGAQAPQRPGVVSGRARETARTPATQPPAKTGQVVHDERGNAMWDWLKQTGRNAIESTTRLLRKLEAPELKVEQPEEEELRIQPDSGSAPGGGYDPYNQPIKSRRTPTK
jgi:hypothetical protein